MNCRNNLNQDTGTLAERLTEDSVMTVVVTTSSTTLLPPNIDRRIVKIFLLSTSAPPAEVWIRYGSDATLNNSAHPLLLRNLLIIDSRQVVNEISAVCSSGTAQLRVCSAEVL